LPASSVTVCWAKNSRVTRRAVASAATALAPFSQNSKVDAWLRSGQAQPGQSKPSAGLSTPVSLDLSPAADSITDLSAAPCSPLLQSVSTLTVRRTGR
jgi:hypothetical protein